MSRKKRESAWSRSWKRARAVCLLSALLLGLAASASGCAKGKDVLAPLREGWRNTLEGSYQVKAREGNTVLGVGVYSGGSFRIILEETPRMVIYNRETGEGWLVNLHQKVYEPLDSEKATQKAGFLPSQVMKPYFELESFWTGDEFRMDTPDGRTIIARLGGPGHLPSYWEASSRGKVLKRIDWEYRRVGEVSSDNFRLPEGLSPGR